MSDFMRKVIPVIISVLTLVVFVTSCANTNTKTAINNAENQISDDEEHFIVENQISDDEEHFIVEDTSKKTAISNAENQISDDKREGIISDFKKTYSAIEIPSDDKNHMFSVELVDKYRGKNIYTPIYRIKDVFYESNEMYVYIDRGNNEKYILQISDEQFSKIKSLKIDFFDDLHIIYRFDELVTMLPGISADFSFDISAHADISSEDLDAYYYDNIPSEDLDVTFNTKLIKGVLVDIMKI